MDESPRQFRLDRSNWRGLSSITPNMQAPGSLSKVSALSLRDRRPGKCSTQPKQRGTINPSSCTSPADLSCRLAGGDSVDFGLRFSERYTYDSRREGITIPAVLKAGEKKIELLAKIDTGARYCLFAHGYGEALGLRVEEGARKTFATANSRAEAYGHEISIQVLGTETTATAYFFADPGIERNVLGLRGWLDRLRFGLVDHDEVVYIADYNK